MTRQTFRRIERVKRKTQKPHGRYLLCWCSSRDDVPPGQKHHPDCEAYGYEHVPSIKLKWPDDE